MAEEWKNIKVIEERKKDSSGVLCNYDDLLVTVTPDVVEIIFQG